MSLKISKDLVLPLDAITQTFAILAMRRIGKTYTASVMAEEFVAASLPFVALDPTGAWWGLRAAADGKSAGLPVVIIGGEHGDVPLEPTAGKVIADLVVDHPGFYVLDMSSTESNAEQDRFAADFAERLYRRKNNVRTPLHLFVDEADSFAPQRPMDGQQRMLGAFEALVRRGGIRGIGVTLITQRPAVLNKNVLTQADSLIALQMNSSQDQDAIEDWVKRNGTKEQRDIMMESLASLPLGEAWFWSPGWLRIFKKIHIRQRRTFNSSATPKAGEKLIIPQKLAPVDLLQLGKEIADTIERATENDPSVLKRKISELKQKVAKLEQHAAKSVTVQTKTERVGFPVIMPGQERLLHDVVTFVKGLAVNLEEAKKLASAVESMKSEILTKIAAALPAPVVPARIVAPRPVAVPRAPMQQLEEGEVKLGKCASAILSVLLSYPNGRSKSQAAMLSGYSIGSSTFGNGLTELSKAEVLVRSGDHLSATPGAESLIPGYTPLPKGEKLREHWLHKFGGAPKQFFSYLITRYPDFCTRDELAAATGYSLTASTFGNALTSLRAPDLLDEDGQNLRISPTLFEE